MVIIKAFQDNLGAGIPLFKFIWSCTDWHLPDVVAGLIYRLLIHDTYRGGHCCQERYIWLVQNDFYRQVIHGFRLDDILCEIRHLTGFLGAHHGKYHVARSQGLPIVELNAFLQVEGILCAVLADAVILAQYIFIFAVIIAQQTVEYIAVHHLIQVHAAVIWVKARKVGIDSNLDGILSSFRVSCIRRLLGSCTSASP